HHRHRPKHTQGCREHPAQQGHQCPDRRATGRRQSIMKAGTQPGNGRLDRWTTYREAMEQPNIWRAWAGALEAHASEISAWLKQRRHEEIWFCGAGTSAFIGDTLCSYLNRPDTGPRYRSIPTTDLVSCPANYLPSDRRILVVSFGRSGDS